MQIRLIIRTAEQVKTEAGETLSCCTPKKNIIKCLKNELFDYYKIVKKKHTHQLHFYEHLETVLKPHKELVFEIVNPVSTDCNVQNFAVVINIDIYNIFMTPKESELILYLIFCFWGKHDSKMKKKQGVNQTDGETLSVEEENQIQLCLKMTWQSLLNMLKITIYQYTNKMWCCELCILQVFKAVTPCSFSFIYVVVCGF